jgi:LysM domain
MILGNRGSAWRCLLVWVLATALAALTSAWPVAAARPTWSAARAGALDTLPLDRAVTGLAATALIGCAVWAWAATTATVLEAGRGVRASAAPWRLPSGVRRVVLAACGVALVGGLASPALAAGPGHGRHLLAGLPLPDRATAPRHHQPEAVPGRPSGPSSHKVVVSPGDSLWSIATADLPRGASDARVTARWHAVYAANLPVIGPDPDLLEPGQRLRLPGKEAS